jgi:hypothetical protein
VVRVGSYFTCLAQECVKNDGNPVAVFHVGRLFDGTNLRFMVGGEGMAMTQSVHFGGKRYQSEHVP